MAKRYTRRRCDVCTSPTFFRVCFDCTTTRCALCGRAGCDAKIESHDGSRVLVHATCAADGGLR